jgi:Flp pilus assembly pilin Flp
MPRGFYRFWNEEDGQDLIEYSLLIVFIGIATMFFITGTQPAVNSIWTGTNCSLASASTAAGS